MWEFDTGIKSTTSINQWIVGDSAHFGIQSKRALYITPNQQDWTYDASYSGFIVCYRPMTLAAGTYTLRYDWIFMGSNAYDAVYVCWVDSAVTTNSNWSMTSLSIPSWLRGQVANAKSSYWQTVSQPFTATGNAGKLVVVFSYSKGYAVKNPAPAVDNIEIFPGEDECTEPIYFFTGMDNAGNYLLRWDGNDIAGDSTIGDSVRYDILYYNYHSQDTTYELLDNIGTPGTNIITLPPMTEEGLYHFYVRSKCDSAHYSNWVHAMKFVWIKGLRCIDLFDMNPGNTGAAKCYHTSDCGYMNLYQNIGQRDYGYSNEASRHTIHYMPGETDPHTGGGLPTVPEGEIASIRLNGWTSGCNASTIEYDYEVEAGVSDLLVLKYACVLENPGHDELSQPRFKMEILKGNSPIDPCAQCDFKAGFGDVNRWHHKVYSSQTIDWCDWQTVTISLRNYIGATLKIRLTAFDCTQMGHFGYAYFTLNCAPGDLEGMGCGDYATDHFTAPDGFEYRWYQEDNPSVILSDSATLQISPTDTCSYLVDLINPDKPNCYYTLVANPNPREPKAEADMLISSENCVNQLCLINLSYVLRTNRETGVSHQDSTERLTLVEWILPDTTIYGVDTLCLTEGQVGEDSIKLVIGISGEGCTDTLVLKPSFPDIMEDGRVVDTLNICDTVYIDNNGRRRYMPETGGPIIDTLESTLNEYGCKVPVYHHVWLYANYDTTYVKRMCDGGSVVWEADGREYKNTRPVTAMTDTFYYDITTYSQHGCDSIMRLVLIVDPSLQVEFGNDTIYACPDDGSFEIPYRILSGMVDNVTVYFDYKTKAAGFQSRTFAPGEDVIITFPDGSVRPDDYDLLIDFSSELCSSEPIRLPFKTEYPKAIVAQKDGFMALLNADYNGGSYQYSSILWLRNGVPVEDATTTYITVPEADRSNEDVIYQVRLVRDGEDRPYYTCPIVYYGYTAMDEVEDTDMQVKKILRDGQLLILREGVWYNVMGIPF